MWVWEENKRTILGRASSIDMKEKVRCDEAISLSRAHGVWKKRRGWTQEDKTRPGREWGWEVLWAWTLFLGYKRPRKVCKNASNIIKCALLGKYLWKRARNSCFSSFVQKLLPSSLFISFGTHTWFVCTIFKRMGSRKIDGGLWSITGGDNDIDREQLALPFLDLC